MKTKRTKKELKIATYSIFYNAAICIYLRIEIIIKNKIKNLNWISIPSEQNYAKMNDKWWVIHDKEMINFKFPNCLKVKWVGLPYSK